MTKEIKQTKDIQTVIDELAIKRGLKPSMKWLTLHRSKWTTLFTMRPITHPR